MSAQLDKKGLMNLLRAENERIMDYLITFNVPDSIEDPDCDSYLLQNDKTVANKNKMPARNNAQIDELEERLNTIKNKLKAKKSPLSERAKTRREAKKLKKNKEFKKVLVSAAKAMKNENQKFGISKTEPNGNDEQVDSKKDIKPVLPKHRFNEEGKIVFSKFDFASHPGAKQKKSHQNPREILKKIKDTDKKIKDLKEQGELEKAAEIKNDIAWKNAFDKIEGKKVKDDPKLLYKTLKKRKVEKKKAKQNWKDRQEKVQSDIQQRAKKREENIQKRVKDTKNRKLKRASKKGRVIPGF